MPRMQNRKRKGTSGLYDVGEPHAAFHQFEDTHFSYMNISTVRFISIINGTSEFDQ